jgi:hypothetical protein
MRGTSVTGCILDWYGDYHYAWPYLWRLANHGSVAAHVTFNAIQQMEQSVALVAAGEEVGKPV